MNSAVRDFRYQRILLIGIFACKEISLVWISGEADSRIGRTLAPVRINNTHISSTFGATGPGNPFSASLSVRLA
jgi:hypothetical protein